MSANVVELSSKAKKLISERNYQQAVRVCRRALLTQPDQVDIRVLLGEALLALDRYDEVRVEMQILADRLDDPDPNILRMLGEAYLRVGQPSRATIALERALEIAPDDEEALELLEELEDVEEKRVETATVERWFETDADATVEMSSYDGPEDDEEDFGATPPSAEASAESVQVDPGYASDFEDKTNQAELPQGGFPNADLLKEIPGTAPLSPSAEVDDAPLHTGTAELSADDLSPFSGDRAPETSLRPPSPSLPPPPTSSVKPRIPTIRLSGPPPPPGASKPPAPTPPAPTPPAPAIPSLPPLPPLGIEPTRAGEPPRPELFGGDDVFGGSAGHDGGLPPLEIEPTRASAREETSELQLDDFLDELGPSSTKKSPGPIASEEVKLDTSDLGELLRGPIGSDEVKLSTKDLGDLLAPIHTDELKLSTDDIVESPPHDPLSSSLPPLPPLAGEATRAKDMPELAPLEGERTHAREMPELPPLAGEATRAKDMPELGPLPSDPTRDRLPGHAFSEDAPTSMHISFQEDAKTSMHISARDDEPTTTHRSFREDEPTRVHDRGLAPLPIPKTNLSEPRFPDAAIPSPSGGLAETLPPMNIPLPRRQVPPQGNFQPSTAPRPGGGGGATAPLPRITSKPTLKDRARVAFDALKRGASPNASAGPWYKRAPVGVWVLAAGLPVLLIALAISMYTSSQSEEELALAFASAQSDGLATSLNAALTLDADVDSGDDESVARRALMYAMAALEHSTDGAADRAASLLSNIDSDEVVVDAEIAKVYLALANGDVPGTDFSLQRLAATAGGEAAFARARVAAVKGEIERAAAEAGNALASDPSSPRRASLYGWLIAMKGDAPAAKTTLAAIPSATSSPSIRLVQARIHQLGSEAEGATREATAVIDELGTIASPVERGWAHIIRGHVADAAENDLRAAMELRPPGDEAYGLALAETLLHRGMLDEAKTTLEGLPASVARAGRRASVSSEVYLAAGDLPAVERALTSAPAGPQASYLQGRLAEARGQSADARRHYEAAAADPVQFIRARTRLGALTLAAGETTEAIGLMDPAAARAPADEALIPVYVNALLTAGRLDRANEVIQAALIAKPGLAVFEIAKAKVALRRGETREAMEVLMRVVATRPDDAELHATLGEAARVTGNLTQAETSLTRALELTPGNAAALVSVAHLRLDQLDDERARSAIAAAETGGARGRSLDFAKARMLVLEGKGVRAVRVLEAIRGMRGDPVYVAALAWARLEAEESRSVPRLLRSATARGKQNLEALLALATNHIRGGRLGPAETLIGRAEAIVRSRSMGDVFDARLLAVRARHRFERGRMDEAANLAREALRKDTRNSDAHYVLALVALEQNDGAENHLRNAIHGRMPMPETLSQYVLNNPRASDVCAITERYLAAAPRGVDARDVRLLTGRCR